MGQAKICVRAECKRAREQGGAYLFLATNRLIVYLFLATDSSTLNMIIYSDRKLITK
jgi:hypothetical protein